MFTGFYNALRTVTFITMASIVIVLALLNAVFEDMSPFVGDMKSILIGVFCGLFFSFLLTIKDVRTYILKSVSHFMTDDSYIDKISDDEVVKLKNKIINRIHGTDVVSNKESLFNYLSELDSYMSMPHRSILNETWIYEYLNEEHGLVKINRYQTFRVHTLDLESHPTYRIKYRNLGGVNNETEFEYLKSQCNIKINVDGNEIVPKMDDEIVAEYDKVSNEYSIIFSKDVNLVKEYTKINIDSTRVEVLDGSIAFYSLDATYGLSYDIVLPEGLGFTNIYHSNTMDLKEQQSYIRSKGNKLSVKINGWQLPGLIFVATYEDTNKCRGYGGACNKLTQVESPAGFQDTQEHADR